MSTWQGTALHPAPTVAHFYVTYDYAPDSQVTAIRENGGTALASYSYDGSGWLTRIDRANGEDTVISRDWFARPTRLDHSGLSATDFTYNPASQLLTRSISNDAFVWNHHVNVDRAYAVNTLNQYTSAGAVSFSYDSSGNLTASGSDTFNYDPANRMTGAGVGGVNSSIYYDGLGRIERRFGGGIASTVFLHDDDALVAEYNHSGTMLRRYVHGPGVDDPIVWYEGSSTADRRFLHADERGSIVAITDNAGGTVNINTYDDWGIPAPGNLGRFGYTGQIWIDELGLNYYKARFYSPTLGRFMQTDPIGYDDGMNMYAYVGNDPVNGTDPSGAFKCEASEDNCKAIAASVRRLRRQGSTMTHSGLRIRTSAGNALRGVANFYDQDNVTVSNVNLPSDEGGHTLGNHSMNADGSHSIGIDFAAIQGSATTALAPFNSHLSSGQVSMGILLGVVAHEGGHGVQRAAGRVAESPPESVQLEIQAYNLQSHVMDYHNLSDGPGHLSLWRPGISTEDRRYAIRRRAVESCNRTWPYAIRHSNPCTWN